MIRKLLVTSLFFSSVVCLTAQSQKDREVILKTSEKSIIPQTLSKQLDQLKSDKASRINAYVKGDSTKLKPFVRNGVTYQLVNVLPTGEPIYYRTFNRGSGFTINADRLYPGGSLGLEGIDGTGLVAGVWDEDIVLQTHTEFKKDDGASRVTKGDNAYATGVHATHVGGTIAAKGVVEHARGIAYNADLISYDWNNDLIEMRTFASKGYLVSNHSYGPAAQQIAADGIIWYFGAYVDETVLLDNLAYAYPYYQPVIAAGNDRDEAHLYHPTKNGYDLTTHFSNGKNTLAVGAVEELLNYTSPQDVKITVFSNAGPTDDGRIKPNLVAKGYGVYSTSKYSANSYATNNGTSMASPAIAGSVLLLQQLYSKEKGSYMRSATVRGLLQHTTMEAGSADGPDYMYGWGLANLEDAAKVIVNEGKTDGLNTSLIKENTLSNTTNEYTEEVVALGTDPLIVSISWTERAGPVNSGTLDWAQASLLNDLDVRVFAEDGTEHKPWILNKNSPTAPAQKGDNIVDNFERIDISAPVANGKYTIKVTCKNTIVDETGTGSDAKQLYSLIVTGITPSGLNSIEDETASGSEVVRVYPVPARDILNVVAEDNGKYKLYNLLGSLIQEGTLQQGVNTLNVSSLQAGTYLIRAELQSGETKTTTVVIK